MEVCTILAQFGTSSYQNRNISVLREETEQRQKREETEKKRARRTKETPMELDALEAVRRLTMERDALANELDAVKGDFRVSCQTLDSIRAATGLHNYGYHLAVSLKAMKEDRDALAENGATRGCNVPLCAMCRFWLEQEVEAECPRRGDCRRYPPAPDPDSSFAAFPVTMHDCWCGEWQAK